MCAVVFILGFAADDGVLARSGLDMSVLAVGTCLIIAATAQPSRRGAAQSAHRAAVVLEPLRWLGRRSYEVYLTHMFVVMGFFHLFVAGGRPGAAVTPLFFAVVVFSGILGEIVARYFSDPLNAMLRHHWE